MFCFIWKFRQFPEIFIPNRNVKFLAKRNGLEKIREIGFSVFLWTMAISQNFYSKPQSLIFDKI